MEKISRNFTKQDIAILLVLILFGVVASIWIYLPDRSYGTFLDIRQNGQVIKTLPLYTDHEETITSNDGGSNTFSIKDGVVSMTRSDCGDHTCIRTGKIKKTGESIVCLPHRLVLQITTDKNENDIREPDMIAH